MVRVLGTLLLTLSEKMAIFFIFKVKMGKSLAVTNKICDFSGYISLRGNTVRKYKDSLRLIYRVYAKQLSLYSICEGPIKFNFNYYYYYYYYLFIFKVDRQREPADGRQCEVILWIINF